MTEVRTAITAKKNRLLSITILSIISLPIKPAIGGIPAIENNIIEMQPAVSGCERYNPERSFIDVTLT